MGCFEVEWDGEEVSVEPPAQKRIANNWCRFNAIAFYLDIADMLAKEGL